MIWISHRGNLDGRCELENHPKQIQYCLNLGFDVEIDVWMILNQLYLGHDEPTFSIDESFLSSNKNHLWCHAKNIYALHYMLQNNIHCFWHQNDSYTITSKGYVWTYPTTEVLDNCIVNQPNTLQISKGIGVCADNIIVLQENYVKYK